MRIRRGYARAGARSDAGERRRRAGRSHRDMVIEIESRPEGSATVSSRTVEELLAFARESGVTIVDLRFTDLPGTQQHFSIPIGELSADLFTAGIGFDGSSIRGFPHI